jgi:predicted anti-sigma-YlaC factor YlaD
VSRCEQVQEAMSARLDGEPAGLGESEVAAHVTGCAACRAYEEQLHELTRRARVRPLPPALDVPDLAARVTEAARVARPGTNPYGLPGGDWPLERLLLLVLGLVQLVLSVPPLLGADVAASLHVSREVGVTDIALAVGLLAATWQPWRAAGMLPVVLTLGVGLATVAVVDVVAGRVSAAAEAPHLLAPVSALLLWLLRRRTPSPGGVVAAAPRLTAVADDDRRDTA